MSANDLAIHLNHRVRIKLHTSDDPLPGVVKCIKEPSLTLRVLTDGAGGLRIEEKRIACSEIASVFFDDWR